MIKINHLVSPSDVQMIAVILGMRNPMNSWDMTDSNIEFDPVSMEYVFNMGSKDADLMRRLCDSGTSHRKFLRMMPIIVDIQAPLYWWKEFDTYKVGTVSNSCSTMHKIQEKAFEPADFSMEHLDILNVFSANDEDHAMACDFSASLMQTIGHLNAARRAYLKSKDKRYWWQMIQLLPSSYNQKRTISMNYEVLMNIYHDRKAHKLDEWVDFCHWVEEEMPYSWLICDAKN